MTRQLARALLAASLAVLATCRGTADAAAAKKLIEFGWDEPDPRFMREHIAEMQATPFDGCVFHVDYRNAAGHRGPFTWEVWGHRRFVDSDLDSARADLRATAFGRFRDNFLRVNVTPADLDWFEDHGTVMANLELAARLAREGGCPGILFDVEPYRGKLWDFRAQSQVPPRTWDEMAAQVRTRGAEAMHALERGYPGLTVFMTMAYSQVLETSRAGRTPLAELPYGLLKPFLDGMLSAASGRTRFVDGHEQSYPYRDPALFAAKADTIRHAVRRLAAQPDRYSSRFTVGFGIWLDHDWTHLGWDARNPSKNHFTPAALGVAVQAALDHADRYVWIYSETPRWWTAEGGSRLLPAAYDSVLRHVRR